MGPIAVVGGAYTVYDKIKELRGLIEDQKGEILSELHHYAGYIPYRSGLQMLQDAQRYAPQAEGYVRTALGQFMQAHTAFVEAAAREPHRRLPRAIDGLLGGPKLVGKAKNYEYACISSVKLAQCYAYLHDIDGGTKALDDATSEFELYAAERVANEGSGIRPELDATRRKLRELLENVRLQMLRRG